MEINGKPVVDATEHMMIDISPDDCLRGKTKDPGSCAAARAIMRDYDVKAARVHVGLTYVEEEDRWLRYRTSAALRTELVAFDRGGPFEPGTYMLSPPPKSATLEFQRTHNKGASKRRNGKGKTPKRTRHETTNVRPRGANK